ncbi:hypothetical protein MIDIC_150007 [Alphaproteobacteria bacterium]
MKKDFGEIALKQTEDVEEVCRMLGISKTSVFRKYYREIRI